MIHETFQIGDNPNTTLTTYISPSAGYLERKPMVIVLPGGGFLDCSYNEGECVALHFLRAGMNAAVLVYTNAHTAPGTPAMPRALHDIAEAIALVRVNAEEWQVDTDRVVLLGFSAGAQLSALYGGIWRDAKFDATAPVEARKPNACILGYPPLEGLGDTKGSENAIDMQAVVGGGERMLKAEAFIRASSMALCGHYPLTEADRDVCAPIRCVGKDNPPTFIWQTFGDEILNPLQSLHYAEALSRAGVPCELHVFDRGGHGMSLADRTSARKAKGIDSHVAHWAGLSAEWIERL